MILKYADGVDPFRGEVIGGVYQRYAAGEQMMSTKKNDRYPYALQWQRASTLIGLTRYWRMLSSAEQTAWNDFAATYPQPTQWNPARYLNGYNLFCRWNFFNRLVNGQATAILTTPDMSTVADTNLSFTITNTGSNLVIDFSWSRSGEDIWCAIFMSRVVSSGVNYIASQPRFIGSISNSSGFEYKYGLLYNRYCFTGGNTISRNSVWNVPTAAQWVTLQTFFGGSTVAGGPLKETGLNFWATPNTGATNSSGFNGRGTGRRSGTTGAVFGELNTYCRFWTLDIASSNYQLINSTATFSHATTSGVFKFGYPVRLVKTAAGVPNYTIGSYTGNDGKIYPTCVYNGLEFILHDLCETLDRSLNSIPDVPIAANWLALVTPGLCAYNNDWSNAFVNTPSSYDITQSYFNFFGRLPQAGDKVLINVIKFNKISGQFLPEQKFFQDVL